MPHWKQSLLYSYKSLVPGVLACLCPWKGDWSSSGVIGFTSWLLGYSIDKKLSWLLLKYYYYPSETSVILYEIVMLNSCLLTVVYTAQWAPFLWYKVVLKRSCFRLYMSNVSVFFNEYGKVLNIDSFNICFSPRSPLKVKEDDEVDNLDIKLGMKKKSKRVYQSQPPEVGLKISRSLKVSSLLQPYLIHNMTGICFIFHIHIVIWHTHIHKHGMHLFYIAYWYDI